MLIQCYSEGSCIRDLKVTGRLRLKTLNHPKNLVEFANWIEDSTKVVFSTTLKRVEWKNSELIRIKSDKDISEEVKQLKQQPGKDMVIFGDARMAATLVELGLIDEYRLKLEPVILGNGKPLFKEINERVKLKLVKSKGFNSGVVGLYYEPLKKHN